MVPTTARRPTPRMISIRPVLSLHQGAPLADLRQDSLLLDYAGQTAPTDGAPVFTLAGPQAEPEDDPIQPDAVDSFGA